MNLKAIRVSKATCEGKSFFHTDSQEAHVVRLPPSHERHEAGSTRIAQKRLDDRKRVDLQQAITSYEHTNSAARFEGRQRKQSLSHDMACEI